MSCQEGKFQGFQQTGIFYRYYTPVVDAGAVVLIVHGLAEHSGRYRHFIDYCLERGLVVCTMDLRGHGKSEGTPGYVERFGDYLADLGLFLSRVKKDFAGHKIFLLGHSLGGTIAVSYAVSRQDEFAGLVLSAPVLRPGTGIPRWQITLSRRLSVIAPKIGVARLNSSAISRSPEVVRSYREDELVYHGQISARLATEILNTIERDLPGHFSRILLPLLVMYGTADTLSNPDGSWRFYRAVGSADKILKPYEGLYHEIFNEPEQRQVFIDVGDWLTGHI